MTNEEIKKELEKYEIKDNPFDVLCYNALELARMMLFACSRLRNPVIPEPIRETKEHLGYYIDIITDQFNTLFDMSDDTVALCRKTSYYDSHCDKFNDLNDKLIKAENVMETVWTRCNPNRNDTFEKIRLGEDSKEYKHILYLRKVAKELCDTYKSDKGTLITIDYLCSMIDVIERPEDCVPYFMSKESFDEKIDIIKKYKLSVGDIHYLESYLYAESYITL